MCRRHEPSAPKNQPLEKKKNNIVSAVVYIGGDERSWDRRVRGVVTVGMSGIETSWLGEVKTMGWGMGTVWCGIQRGSLHICKCMQFLIFS